MTREYIRRPLDRLSSLFLGGLALATVAAQFARLGWLPELATHFRPQYLLAALLLLPVFGIGGRRVLVLVSLAVVLVNGWYVGPYLLAMVVPASAADVTGQSVSMISLNLYYRNGRHGDVRKYLERTHPDVLVLEELTPEWVSELRSVTVKYPYWMSLDHRNPWGLGVYSRFPLIGAKATDLGVRGSVNVVATIDLPGDDVQLVAAHLSSPGSPQRFGRRNAQLRELATLLNSLPTGADGSRQRRLLVGDLNVTPFSPYMRDLLESTGMRDARRSHGLLGTWPTWMAPLQVHIDHCIADVDVVVTRVARGPDVGSDHYPLEISLR